MPLKALLGTAINRVMLTPRQFYAADGWRLSGFVAAVANPRGVLILCHGLGEHCRRYDHVVTKLNQAGWCVYTCDLRGHGQSQGKRGHILAWNDYVSDMLGLYAAAESDGLSHLPWVQFGHSMGGLVAVHTALAQQQRLAGLALSAPLLGIAVQVPPLKAFAGKILSKLAPSLTLANEIDANQISRDASVVSAYKADPLNHDRVSARWFTEMLKALKQAQATLSQLTLPVWLAHGTADRLTDCASSQRLVSTFAGPVSSHFLTGYYHEIFNEPEPDRQRALQLLLDWLSTLSTKPKAKD